MITRFALFEGSVKPGQVDAFRAPEFPLILAISYPDEAAMTAALDSPFRFQSKDVTGQIVDEYFEGRIHHHVTERHEYVA